MDKLPESNKLSIIKLEDKPAKQWQGLVPLVKNTFKSFLYGNDSSDYYNDNQTYVDATGDFNNFKLLLSSHVFNRKSLKTLVDMGYTNSPAGFGIINKILLAQRNIVFSPYWKGKPYKSKELTLDMNYGLRMLLLTGTALVYEKEIVGFSNELTFLNTLDIEETPLSNGRYSYKYWLNNSSYINLDPEKMIFITMPDIVKRDTQMGLPPFQSAAMPIESLKEMYIADTSTLKNRGSDVLLTNDTETPLMDDENGTYQDSFNKRIGGAKRSGTVAVTSAKVRAVQLGRSAKELALWEGYKFKTRDVCTALQVDSGLFNDPDNRKYANAVESNRALYADCVIPFTKLITENKQLKAKLGYDIFLDVSEIDCLQTAQSERAAKSKTVTDAIISLNEKVKYGVITPEIAVRILVSEWGYEEQEAQELIIDKPDPIAPPTTVTE